MISMSEIIVRLKDNRIKITGGEYVKDLIRCRDCDFWEKQEDSLQGRCSLTGSYPTGSWYCANAKEKEDE